MRITNLLLTALILGIHTLSVAQDFKNYKPLQSSGDIPQDFLLLSSEKYEANKATISKKDKAIERKAKRKFFLENSFLIQNLLYTGKILFNDPIGKYVNRVADELLKNEPELRKNLRFYIVKSPSVNAFTTNEGIIFINLGLIAQLENEAQLAFILAHEIIHYKNQHVIEGYVENIKIERGSGAYKALSADTKVITRNSHSKELETEADLEGLELYLKSEYSVGIIDNVFDVLQFAYLPFDDVKFEKNFFEDEYFKFPQEYFLEETNKIKFILKEEEESKSTHPSIPKRRKSVADRIQNISNTNRKEYVVSKDDFLTIRKISRYELAYQYLIHDAYEEAIYHTYLLLQKDPENMFLQKIVAKSLYGLSRYYISDEFSFVHTLPEEIEGKSQQVYHFFDKISDDELAILALKYSWRLKEKYPEDFEIDNLVNTLFKNIQDNYSQYAKEYFLITKRVQEKNQDTTVQAEEELSKYDKIKNEQEKLDKEDFIKYAFVKELKDPEFLQLFETYSSGNSEDKTTLSRAEKRRKARQEGKEARRVKRRGYRLGIDKVVIVNPIYAKYNEKKRESTRYIASETAQIQLQEKIQKNAKITGLDVVLLGRHAFTGTDVDKFNDYAFLRQWISTKANQQEKEVEMINLDMENVQEIAKKYGTSYFCWMGFVSVKEQNIDIIDTFMNGLAPYDTFYLCLVYDITTGKPVYTQVNYMDAKDSRPLTNSILFDSFYQINRKK